MASNPNDLIPSRPPRSVSSGVLAHARLATMKLSEAVLRRAVEAGERERRSCSANNTPGGPGFRAYDETVRTLRDEVKSDRQSPWVEGSRNGLYGIVHNDGILAVTVMTGDESTGVDGDRQPKSKNPKGSLVKNLARMHNGQSVFTWVRSRQPLTAPGDEETWVLLIHSAEEEVRFELSLPTSVDGDERLCSWRERILFDPIKRPEPLEDIDDTEEIDFDISRRA